MSLHKTFIVAAEPESQEAIKIFSDSAELINTVDAWAPVKPIIKSEEDYLKAVAAKRELCSLTCFCSNTNNEHSALIHERENIYGSAMEKYNRKLLVKNKEQRTVLKYLIWGSYFPHINHFDVILSAHNSGNLRKEVDQQGRMRFLVVGLKFKVGNNVFSCDSRGREHRLYLETIGRQATPITWPGKTIDDFAAKHQDVVDAIPLLDASTYHVAYTGNSKGSIAPIKFSCHERNHMIKNF